MFSKWVTIIFCLVLYAFIMPAFSHDGHTSAPHIHNSVEFSLLAIVVVAILYRLIKK